MPIILRAIKHVDMFVNICFLNCVVMDRHGKILID